MREALLAGLGGFVGAILRHLTSLAFGPQSFPYATLTVNVVGSFALGVVVGLVDREAMGEAQRHLVAVGLLGALTTFSTFSVETLQLLRAGQTWQAAASVVLNVGLALAAARLGLAVSA